jgi:hypothetical protein
MLEIVCFGNSATNLLWKLGQRARPSLSATPPTQCFPVFTVVEFFINNLDQGQGGSQAIEDAEALGVALEAATSAQVPEQLKKVEKVRYERATFIQKCSREMAQGPRVDESGAQGALNGYRFAQVISHWIKANHTSTSIRTRARERNSVN